MARMGDTRLPKCGMLEELVRGAGCVGASKKRGWGVSWTSSELSDDCSPRRGGMAQNGGTRGVTFHGEMDRCREVKCWITASSGMPERDGKIKKRMAQIKRARAGSLALVD